MNAAHELRAFARYHEESGDPITPEMLKLLAAAWDAESRRYEASPTHPDTMIGRQEHT